MQARQQEPEERWPERDAREQLAEDRRLAEAHHRLAEQPADAHEDDQLREEYRENVRFGHARVRLPSSVVAQV